VLNIKEMEFQKKVLITGGAGFIGSHLVKRFVRDYPNYLIVNFDALTYAGNLDNLREIENAANYKFIKGDIEDDALIKRVFDEFSIDSVIHCAAESHVDRSIMDPLAFVRTNVLGTCNLLNAARHAWEDNMDGKLFYHVSTDEVYGELGAEGLFTEETSYSPRSPYSASKASSDHFVRAYFHTYGMPVVISNCSNNYGPNQFPEKLLPVMISLIKASKSLPVYGKGENIRDWLYVEDHVDAMNTIFHKGKLGETYNIGGDNEWRNIDLVKKLCALGDEFLDRPVGTSEQLITFVKDRAGHDLRYAIDASKIKQDLGWNPSENFESGLRKTFLWYLENEEWIENVKSGQYLEFYKKQYELR
jgi:dTDP-glucose 4,6-dehydratase